MQLENILIISFAFQQESNEKLIKFEISDIHKLEEERTFKVYECEKRGELIKFLKKEFEGYGRSIKVVTFN